MRISQRASFVSCPREKRETDDPCLEKHGAAAARDPSGQSSADSQRGESSSGRGPRQVEGL